MKKLAIVAAFLLLTLSSFAQDSKSIYHKYSDMDGVSAVYISPVMFKMIGKIPNLEFGDDGNKIDISPIIKSLKGFYLLSSSNESVNDKLNADVKKLLNGGKFDMVMEAKDNGETMRIYTNGDEQVINSFIMMAQEKYETTFISMDGLISRKDFEKLLESVSQ